MDFSNPRISLYLRSARCTAESALERAPGTRIHTAFRGVQSLARDNPVRIPTAVFNEVQALSGRENLWWCYYWR